MTPHDKQNRRERIGLALEDFVCKHTLIKDLSEKYKIGNNLLAASIEAYFGRPGERVMIRFEMVDSDIDNPYPN
jgi:hypothetical protein